LGQHSENADCWFVHTQHFEHRSYFFRGTGLTNGLRAGAWLENVPKMFYTIAYTLLPPFAWDLLSKSQEEMVEASGPFDRSALKKTPARATRLGIPLHGIDPEKSLFPKSALGGRFSLHNSGLDVKNRRGKYAQMSQTESLQSEPLAGTEAPLAKALANRLSQRPASLPAGQPRHSPDMTR
jgi:hypothetical protein